MGLVESLFRVELGSRKWHVRLLMERFRDSVVRVGRHDIKAENEYAGCMGEEEQQ